MGAGCSSTVTGSAQPAAPMAAGSYSSPPPSTGSSASPSGAPTTTPHNSTDPPSPSTGAATAGSLESKLPDPSAFPAGYSDTAASLPYRDAVLASEDLSGVHRGARTQPVQCAPGSESPGPGDLALASGTDAASRSTVAVQLVRVSDPLSDYRSTINACTDVESDEFGARSHVSRDLIDASGDEADDVVAFTQSVRSGDGEVTLEQKSTTLVSQVDDVRVSVVGMSQQSDPPDAEALSSLLDDAVAAVRAG